MNEPINRWFEDESPEGLDAMQETILDEIRNNPVFKQYVAHIGMRGNDEPYRRTNNLPWHAMGERYIATAACVVAARNPDVPIYGFKEGINRGLVFTQYARRIASATPYLWSNNMEDLADAAPLPNHVISKTTLPCSAMFWSREVCNHVTLNHAAFKDCENNWMALFDHEEGFGMLADAVASNGEYTGLVGASVRYGTRFPEESKYDPKQLSKLLKRCAFLNSPYISTETHRLPRHQRRQLERAGEPPEKSEERIHVVMLRRKQKNAGEGRRAQPQQGEGMEWQHQWWVSAHYRAQWYATEQAHKVIWIQPYLKGPSDKPILEKVYAVLR